MSTGILSDARGSNPQNGCSEVREERDLDSANSYVTLGEFSAIMTMNNSDYSYPCRFGCVHETQVTILI